MIIDGKKIYFVIEYEFDKIASKLANKLDVTPKPDHAFSYNIGYWNWNYLFGSDSKELWNILEQKLNMTYIKASGPKGCHVFDFNTEPDRLKFQLKYGDLFYD